MSASESKLINGRDEGLLLLFGYLHLLSVPTRDLQATVTVACDKQFSIVPCVFQDLPLLSDHLRLVVVLCNAHGHKDHGSRFQS
jgi:hypothetical protein